MTVNSFQSSHVPDFHFISYENLNELPPEWQREEEHLSVSTETNPLHLTLIVQEIWKLPTTSCASSHNSQACFLAGGGGGEECRELPLSVLREEDCLVLPYNYLCFWTICVEEGPWWLAHHHHHVFSPVTVSLPGEGLDWQRTGLTAICNYNSELLDNSPTKTRNGPPGPVITPR